MERPVPNLETSPTTPSIKQQKREFNSELNNLILIIMKLNSVYAVITASENQRAVAIGAGVGVAVVCGFAAIKVAALGVAGKVAVATVIAGCAGYATHNAVKSGQLTSMLEGLQAEMSNSKEL